MPRAAHTKTHYVLAGVSHGKCLPAGNRAFLREARPRRRDRQASRRTRRGDPRRAEESLLRIFPLAARARSFCDPRAVQRRERPRRASRDRTFSASWLRRDHSVARAARGVEPHGAGRRSMTNAFRFQTVPTLVVEFGVARRLGALLRAQFPTLHTVCVV